MSPATRWEVRKPRLYGSEHVAFFVSEAAARVFAENLAQTKYPGHGLTISTRSRTIYIDHDVD